MNRLASLLTVAAIVLAGCGTAPSTITQGPTTARPVAQAAPEVREGLPIVHGGAP